MPFAVAEKVCEAYRICQRWLATGRKPIHPYVRVGASLLEKIATDELFSVAYERFSSFLDQRLKAHSEDAGVPEEELDRDVLHDLAPLAESQAETHLEMLLAGLWQESRKMDDATKNQFRQQLERVLFVFMNRSLTEQFQLETVSGVKLPRDLAELRQWLAQKTKERGAKAALAKWLSTELDRQVRLSDVSRWIAADRIPDGDTTLKLIEWVHSPKRKQ